MSSRRKFKKKIKNSTNLLIEDAFIESINGDPKEERKMDQLIDTIIDDRFEMLSKISSYPKNGKRAEIRNFFDTIEKELSEKVITYSKAIGRVG